MEKKLETSLLILWFILGVYGCKTSPDAPDMLQVGNSRNPCADLGFGFGGFPRIRGTLIRNILFWGLYWGPFILGKYHLEFRIFFSGFPRENGFLFGWGITAGVEYNGYVSGKPGCPLGTKCMCLRIRHADHSWGWRKTLCSHYSCVARRVEGSKCPNSSGSVPNTAMI